MCEAQRHNPSLCGVSVRKATLWSTRRPSSTDSLWSGSIRVAAKFMPVAGLVIRLPWALCQICKSINGSRQSQARCRLKGMASPCLSWRSGSHSSRGRISGKHIRYLCVYVFASLVVLLCFLSMAFFFAESHFAYYSSSSTIPRGLFTIRTEDSFPPCLSSCCTCFPRR